MRSLPRRGKGHFVITSMYVLEIRVQRGRGWEGDSGSYGDPRLRKRKGTCSLPFS